jgi:two-component system sensor histidine kinase RegB
MSTALDERLEKASLNPVPGLLPERPAPRADAAPARDLAPHVSLPWFVRLRWGALAGQVLALVGAHAFLGVDLPVLPLALLVLATAITNVGLAVVVKRDRLPLPPRHLLGAVMLLDTLLLTALLYFTGGPTNPFSVLYLVHVTLGAVVLGAIWTWLVVGLSVACFGFLFWQHQPLSIGGQCQNGCDFSLHLEGMWVALALAAGFICHFVGRVAAALRRSETELASVRERALRTERLVSLATLAAGAAHELGTPLGTIAVAAKELERAAAKLDTAPSAAIGDDARLIRGEVDRCRTILDRLSVRSGDAELLLQDLVSIEQVVQELRRQLPARQASRLEVTSGPGVASAAVPRVPLLQALGALVKNAFDATGDRGSVALALTASGDRLRCQIEDDGPGMDAGTLARAGDPFFTTKEPGRGMGLGLFLSRVLAERLGGRLDLLSVPGSGTKVSFEIPVKGAELAPV